MAHDAFLAAVIELVQHGGQPPFFLVGLGEHFQLAPLLFHTRKSHADEPERPALRPGRLEQQRHQRIKWGLQVSRVRQAAAGGVILHGGIAHFDRHRFHAFAVRPDLGQELVDHPFGDALDGGEFPDVVGEGFLRGIRFGLLLVRLHPAVILSARHGQHLRPPAAKKRFQFRLRAGAEIAHQPDPRRLQPGRALLTDTGNDRDLEWGQKRRLFSRSNEGEAARLAGLACDGGDQFVRGDPERGGDLQIIPDALLDGADPPGNLLNALAAARPEIKVTLVDGIALHVGRERLADFKHSPRVGPVLSVAVTDEDQVGANFQRQLAGHRRVDSAGPRLVTGRRNDAALPSADRHLFAAQRRIQRLLDGHEERVGVQVNDGGQQAGHHATFGGACLQAIQ